MSTTPKPMPTSICTHWSQEDQAQAIEQDWFMARIRGARGEFTAQPMPMHGQRRHTFKDNLAVMTFLERGEFNQDAFAMKAMAFYRYQNETRRANGWDAACGDYFGSMRWHQHLTKVRVLTKLGLPIDGRRRRGEAPKTHWTMVHQVQAMPMGWALWKGPGNQPYIVRCKVRGIYLFDSNEEAEAIVRELYNRGKGAKDGRPDGAAIQACRFIAQQRKYAYVTAWGAGVHNSQIPGAQPEPHMGGPVPKPGKSAEADYVLSQMERRRRNGAIRHKIPRIKQRLINAGVVKIET